MTRHFRHRQAAVRDVAHRRVRTLTALAGLGSVAGAGTLAVAVAGTGAAAASTSTPVKPATAPVKHVARHHRPPAGLLHTKRVRHHHAAVHRTITAVAPAATPKPRTVVHAAPRHTTKPAPQPSPTQSSTPPQQSSSGGSSSTSGGSHG